MGALERARARSMKISHKPNQTKSIHTYKCSCSCNHNGTCTRLRTKTIQCLPLCYKIMNKMSSISHWITTKSALTNSKKKKKDHSRLRCGVSIHHFGAKEFPNRNRQAGRQAQRNTRRARRTWDWNWKLDNMSKVVCARIEFAMQSKPQSSMILCAALCFFFFS